ncbi:MAG: rRNA maturation RNase YbeY [Crocinitomicaceae bacterium]|jgi:probable rRNA maturation factor|nr:rRNA maturation RNase YbeY [Crocinitomicaceae bacterium]
MVDINYEETDDLELSVDKVGYWIEEICSNEGKKVGDLSLVFCSDNYLLEINQQHLNHDFFTDIVTFDYCVDDLISGDLFISVDRVFENSAVYDVSFLHELHRVIIHGVLHLCGYKDKSEGDEVIMRMKEDEALELISFT